VLGVVGMEPPHPMEGQDLSVLLDGEEPEVRLHFTLGYSEFAWVRDETYAMFAKSDGTGARLYDLREDLGMNRDVADDHPDVVRQMMEGYILKDAGGPLPLY